MIYRGGASCRRETASYPGWLWRCEQRLQSRCLGSELEQRAFECEPELRLGPGIQYPHYSDNDKGRIMGNGNNENMTTQARRKANLPQWPRLSPLI